MKRISILKVKWQLKTVRITQQSGSASVLKKEYFFPLILFIDCAAEWFGPGYIWPPGCYGNRSSYKFTKDGHKFSKGSCVKKVAYDELVG